MGANKNKGSDAGSSGFAKLKLKPVSDLENPTAMAAEKKRRKGALQTKAKWKERQRLIDELVETRKKKQEFREKLDLARGLFGDTNSTANEDAYFAACEEAESSFKDAAERRERNFNTGLRAEKSQPPNFRQFENDLDANGITSDVDESDHRVAISARADQARWEHEVLLEEMAKLADDSGARPEPENGRGLIEDDVSETTPSPKTFEKNRDYIARLATEFGLKSPDFIGKSLKASADENSYGQADIVGYLDRPGKEEQRRARIAEMLRDFRADGSSKYPETSSIKKSDGRRHVVNLADFGIDEGSLAARTILKRQQSALAKFGKASDGSTISAGGHESRPQRTDENGYDSRDRSKSVVR